MNLKKEQVKGYIEEAKLSIESAEIVLDKAIRIKKKLWAHIVKLCYDAMEQIVSAAIANKNELIPKDHPGKIAKFINLYNIKENSEISKILFFWLTKRAQSQYVDIKEGKVVIPHESFDEEDAELIIKESKYIIEKIENLIKNY